MPFVRRSASTNCKSVDDLKLLTVGVDRLENWWRPGVLCIGDAAHTMSPIGGVGINLAIQDAVAASNILAAPLREGRLADADLAAVQARRLFPARATQAVQVFLQNRMIAPSLLRQAARSGPPWPMLLLDRGSRSCAGCPRACWPWACGPST